MPLLKASVFFFIASRYAGGSIGSCSQGRNGDARKHAAHSREFSVESDAIRTRAGSCVRRWEATVGSVTYLEGDESLFEIGSLEERHFFRLPVGKLLLLALIVACVHVVDIEIVRGLQVVLHFQLFEYGSSVPRAGETMLAHVSAIIFDLCWIHSARRKCCPAPQIHLRHVPL